MKRGLLPPAVILSALLAFSAWNAHVAAGRTERWESQLEEAEGFVRQGAWQDARDALARSFRDWTDARTALLVVTWHDAVDDADTLYRRCMLLAESEDAGTLLPELSELYGKVEKLSEMEQFSLGNIL